MDIPAAQRLEKLPPYLFADLRRKITAARQRGVDVISLGIGDPDRSTPDPVVRELIRAVTDTSDPDRHRYGCDSPVEAFPQAVRSFYRRRHGVELGRDQVVTTTGSKDAIVQFCMGVLNPGDLGISPAPGYPTYNIGHVFCSAGTYYLPLLEQNAYLPDLESIPVYVRREAKLLWINYPNNPTTAVAESDFFRSAVEFGRKHNILICHDLAYGENTYDGFRAPSILSVPGAHEVAVEFFSLSKAFSMTGWRVGALVGNASAVKALALVKSNVDNGSLRALQFAAAKALDSSETIVPEVNRVYQKRRDMVVDALKSAGYRVHKPKGTIYVWPEVPARYHGSSAAYAEDLLGKAGVVVTPGLGYGQWGEGHVRISLTYPDDVLAKAMERIGSLGT